MEIIIRNESCSITQFILSGNGDRWRPFRNAALLYNYCILSFPLLLLYFIFTFFFIYIFIFTTLLYLLHIITTLLYLYLPHYFPLYSFPFFSFLFFPQTRNRKVSSKWKKKKGMLGFPDMLKPLDKLRLKCWWYHIRNISNALSIA